MNLAPTLIETQMPDLRLWRRGKVRDIYDLGDRLLIVATDRISAFDVVLPTPIPNKGVVLTQLSNFWFRQLADVVPNHVVSVNVSEYPKSLHRYSDQLAGRSMLVKKTEPLKAECVVRGYLSGSGWKDYVRSGSVCGIRLRDGLRESDKIEPPIFTPSTKAERGHDENISIDQLGELVSPNRATELERVSLALYNRALAHAESRGIILADTKFEFGLLDGQLVWIDEALTPDSSRFWPRDTYEPGKAQRSFDKQWVRDYLETLDWDKRAPGPELPEEIVARTVDKYREAYSRITGDTL